ncbi:MAG: heavy metal translocating P-type ATPase [Phycisphaerae bacterium]
MGEDSAMLEVRFRIAGMDCPDEIAELKQALEGGDGIVALSFNLLQARMTVRYLPTAIEIERIIALVAKTGMKAEVLGDFGLREQSPIARYRGAFGMAVLSGAGTILGLGLSVVPAGTVHHTTWPSALAYVLAIGAAWRLVAPKAWAAVKARRLDMNVLMTIAVVGAVGLGEWSEASTVAFLFTVSHLLEFWSVARARRAIQSLMELSPPTARVQGPDGAEREVDTGQVAVGSRIVVKPGEKFPLDGRLVEGSTSVNQAPVTGEAAPVSKETGDEVFAGTINQDGAVVVEVTKRAGDTVLAGVILLVEQAQAERSPSERFVDRFARYYTPAVVVGALLVCILPPLGFGAPWATWLYRSLILLVIACPCALVISTPVSIVSGLTCAARSGVLIKGGEYLEAVGKTTVVAIDKTGTLTRGQPVVQDVIPVAPTTPASLLTVAAALEQRSEHPIAEAIVEHARERGITPQACEQYQAVRGKGAIATVDGETYLIGNHRLLEDRGVCTEAVHRLMEDHEDCDHIVVALSSQVRPLGVILLADALRKESSEAVAELRRAGMDRVVMLTGDNAGTAKSIAEECGGIDHRAELLPADKVREVKALQAEHELVLMVGDGINDAPALAAADVGVAIGTGGTDAALETADIALMTDDLMKLSWLLRHSRRTRYIIRQNIVLSLAVKVVFVALAIPGLANLWLAIAADMGTSLIVTFNGLRLLRGRADKMSPRP